MPLSRFLSLTEINKGWSGDKKYHAVDANGNVFLLRVTSSPRGERYEDMFRMQKKVAALGVSMCEPIECGKCDEGYYMLQRFVDGVDAEEAVKCMSEDEQYRLGYEAGKYLRLIHTIPAPEDQPDWEPRFNAKIDRKIRMYSECPLKFKGDHYILEYLAANRHLLKDRPQSYQHGDYHIGNMMIEEGKVVVIDFDRYDFGDPWEEFNRIVWCAQAAPAFASGNVDGYFGGEVPHEFWALLALYIGSNMLSSIPWAISFGDAEINTMMNQARDVLDWYDNFTNVIPKWYKGVQNG
jgi:aminoglycoside phosphotransferase (APT) family kinase protein